MAEEEAYMWIYGRRRWLGEAERAAARLRWILCGGAWLWCRRGAAVSFSGGGVSREGVGEAGER